MKRIRRAAAILLSGIILLSCMPTTSLSASSIDADYEINTTSVESGTGAGDLNEIEEPENLEEEILLISETDESDITELSKSENELIEEDSGTTEIAVSNMESSATEISESDTESEKTEAENVEETEIIEISEEISSEELSEEEEITEEIEENIEENAEAIEETETEDEAANENTDENGIIVTAAEEEEITVEDVQNLILTLPSVEDYAAMDDEEKLAAYELILAASEAYDSLSTEDQALVDISLLEALFDYINGLVSVSANETEEETFYLWIYNASGTQVAAYSEWVTDTDEEGNEINRTAEGVISYTDENSETWYLIPVSYFEDALASAGYTFDESDILTCPFLYAPDATSSAFINSVFATYEEYEGAWYVKVQDTGLGTNYSGVARSNIYYNPQYHFWLHVDSYEDGALSTNSVDEQYITDFVGVDDRYMLVPVSYFSAYVSEESLDESSLTAAGTYAIYGEEYTLYESPFMYTPKAGMATSNPAVAYYVYYSGTWYIMTHDMGTGYTAPIRNNIWYTGTMKTVVLSLGNGNGTSKDGDYSGGKSGTNLRYSVTLNSVLANDDMTVTINLPSDDDLSSVFVIATINGEDITVSLGEEKAYDYKLVGWINIATGEYYDVSNGGTTATIDFNNSNVFYADWIAESYDKGGEVSGVDIVGEDTSDFTIIELFDYNELFNLYSATLSQNGTTSETWTDSGSLYSETIISLLADGYSLDEITALDNSFVFLNTGTNASGLLGYLSGIKSWNKNNSAGVTSAWSMDEEASSAIIDLLFNAETADDTLGVHYVGTGNYLFQEGDDGYYYYDATQNAAVYQQSENRFYVYSDVHNILYNGSAASYGTGFTPFNTYTESTGVLNGSTNYWFGMSVEINFYLPNDTGTATIQNDGSVTYGNQYNGEDMIFEFSGDDDVWVYVDGELALNLGGIHGEVSGTINFSTGVVTANGVETQIDLSAGSHTLKIYYLERGAWDSNLMIRFNIREYDNSEGTEVGTVIAQKVWKDADGSEVAYADTEGFSDISIGLYERESSSDYAVDGNTYYYNNAAYEIDENGECYDENSVLIAYISGEYLYVLVNTQVLTYDNEWTFTWELLDISKSYVVLELTGLLNYTASSKYILIQEYDYWTVTEGSELNEAGGNGALYDGMELLITNAAMGSTDVYDSSIYIGDTAYTGYVLSGDLSVEAVAFSMTPELGSDGATYTYGLAWGQTVDKNAIWIVELTGETADDATNEQIPTFYLKNQNGQYLAINYAPTGGSIYLVETSSEATKFNFNSLGELNTQDNTGIRIIFTTDTNNDTTVTVVQGRLNESDVKNAKLYIYKEVYTKGRSYTLTNQEKYPGSVMLTKVDEDDVNLLLEGAVFTIYDDETLESIVGTITTDEYGIAVSGELTQGTYYIVETEAPEGYEITSTDPIKVEITESGQIIDLGAITNKAKTGSITIIKYGSDGTTPIANVTFLCESATEGITYSESLTTDDTGSVVFENLKAGTYKITETQTVDGLQLLTETIEVTIPLSLTKEEAESYGDNLNIAEADIRKDGNYYFYDVTYVVTNNVSFNMPATGGNVSSDMYIPLYIGLILVIIGGEFLYSI